jgi:hypothetical protein
MVQSDSKPMNFRDKQTPPTDEHSTATLVIGGDLRIRSATGGWGALGFTSRFRGARLHDVFPSPHVRAAVLDVLAGGTRADGIVLPAPGGLALCASVLPLPPGRPKPRSVLLRASRLDGRLVVEEHTGRILEANEAAALAFGARMEDLIGSTVADLEPFRPDTPQHLSAWKRLTCRTTLYLGQFASAWNGRGARVEAVLLAPDA